ncbi:centrosome-associated zinc finger protein CP190 [Orussus abietinus]|uniref:centrosome-associated zinc finger protein CP190 n=1 Tax=Orussus abietinus TaxID=222816 RepID=UPI000624FAE5|nr:centrosome-associated zinc finger protein CP190 [Orussus abietinus]XP_012275335.1 centrosome-associated zinc finger protein CP190 [Orussus abietinus]
MSTSVQGKQLPLRGLKQVKVDNWGTFFLQRLQQLYFEEELLDLTIKFPTSDITVQAHRLVITTCTDYFTYLERQQREKDENFDGILIMPPDMPYECVKSIISFMYTGQLEYWTSEQNALYRTAQKMNMTVLTKLLDAQFNTSELQASPPSTKSKPTVQPVIALSKPSTPAKKVSSQSQQNQTPMLPSQPLPGRKLPIWKRKLDARTSFPSPNYDLGPYSSSLSRSSSDVTPGPSRFDLPEAEEFSLGVFSSFDDITYNTKPIVQAPNKPSAENNSEYKSSMNTEADERRNDTTEDEDDDDDPGRDKDKSENSDDDWSGPKGILRAQEVQTSPTKKVRFNLEEKENLEKSKNSPNSGESIKKHAKIIKEVLKKYPHLVKNNKNIRLKIMQKEAKSSEPSTPAKTKVSYVVLKSDQLMRGSADEESRNNGGEGAEKGPWKCTKCDLEEEYAMYYMYRRHMQDVHGEKFDPRVCEHCGYKATKRNILMYHLYTKHNVPPPKSMCFPKCHACPYVALSETLLVRHQINHNHRPTSRTTLSPAEELQCLHCTQTFRDITDLATHEINTGHGSAESREKGHRCPHCGKTFIRITNLQVHLDCAHKDLREAEPAPISLEPSSEAEALSHVASGIAASLAVGDAVPAVDQQEARSSDAEYVVPESLELADIEPNVAYNGQEMAGQQMIMLIDNGGYQQQEMDEHQQQPQQIDISGNEQIVMQGTEEGMIVYIHENDVEQGEQQAYATYREIEMAQETEEIVEEVVEEVEEELMEEEEEEEDEEDEEEDEEEESRNGQAVVLEDGNVDQVEEVIQYVEEETEIVEYDEEQCGRNGPARESRDARDARDARDPRDSVMIVEEEEEEEEEEDRHHFEAGEDEAAKASANRKSADIISDDWDEDSADMTDS